MLQLSKEKHLKHNPIIFIFILLNVQYIFGGPVREVMNIPFTDNIADIEESWLEPIGKTSTVYNYTNLKGGVFILNEKYISHFTTERTWVCYNINYTNLLSNDIRFLPISPSMGPISDEITIDENKIEIICYKKYWRYSRENYHKVKIVINLSNTNNSVKNYSIYNHETNEIIEEYEFEYDEQGRLQSIYAINEWGRVLRKALFYDGLLRIFPVPYFLDENNEIPNLDEIIIFDKNIFKYRIIVSSQPHYGPPDPPKQEKYGYILFEFDENGYEIKQIDYRFGDEEPMFFVRDYDKKDGNNNWTHSTIYTRAVEKHSEIYRIITYK
jgi:hypothetical protein